MPSTPEGDADLQDERGQAYDQTGDLQEAAMTAYALARAPISGEEF
ncbi:hypothetical protein [Mesorhizobium sp. AA22]|nr:hypothetical protein [Mesorhizobium sp. AA22]